MSKFNDKILKKSQDYEQSPKYVADELYKIIRIMITRLPYESRQNAFLSLRDKFREINVVEVSNKRSPGGAVIGTSLSLVKNMLNARDPYFIRLVLDDLIRKMK